jgi:phospholipase/lecithinase/hemolysin
MIASSIKWRTFVVGVVIVALCASAAAGPYSSLVVFGDSLSDVGNTDNVTPFFLKYPGRYYHQGRFSNGPVFVEALATGLGLPPITASTDGGNNFAYGGAQTTETGGIFGDYIQDIDEQVTEFLEERTVDPAALFFVYAGANDLVGGVTDVQGRVNQMTADIGRLVAKGARNFLVPNLPPLGFTPRFGCDAVAPCPMNELSSEFNAALWQSLDSLVASNSSLSIYRLDLSSMFHQARINPAEFGLVNVTAPAAPGLEPGAWFYDTGQIVDEPDTYLFWDDLHPTKAAHALLAERALASLLPLAGDYNADRRVDAGDYTVWRNSLGKTGYGFPADGNRDGIVNRDDFLLWKTHYGESSGGAGMYFRAGSVVPEPSSLDLQLIGGIGLPLAGGFLRRRKPCFTPRAGRQSS